MIHAMNVQSAQSEWVGQVIDGRYSLRQWLGGSGSNGVFVTDRPGGTGQKATIKLIPVEKDAAAWEAGFATAAGLSHPNLMRILDSGRCEIDGAPFVFVVTEYADEVLSEILPMRPLTPAEAKEMLAPVLDALSYIHGQGVAHGHLKPSNILVVNDQLKLSSDSLQPVGNSGGDMHALNVHDAPERADGTLSPASDMWSLGATIVEALTQRPPDWNRASDQNPEVSESLPEPYRKIAASCLRVDGSKRCTIDDVRRSIGLASPPPADAQADSVEELPPARSHFGMMVTVGLVVLTIIGIFLWRFTGPQPSQQTAGQISATSPVTAEPRPAQEAQPTSGSEQPSTPEQAAPEKQPTPQGSAPTSGAASAPSPIPAVRGQIGGSSGAVIKRVIPDVLPSASETIRGTVVVTVRLHVDQAGNVALAEFEDEGPSKYFSRLSLEAARQWKFAPPLISGQLAPSIWTLSFQFTRERTDVIPVQTAP
jgi:hypothetical protein